MSMKKIIAILISIVMVISVFTGCSIKKESEVQEESLTVEDIQEWCESSADAFFNGFKNRNIDVMKYYVSSTASSFINEYKTYSSSLKNKVWLDTFFDSYLAGSQAIAGTFISSGEGVSLHYSLVIADYTSQVRNWLILYETTLTFDVNVETRSAYINNPEVVLDMMDNICNDYTTYVASVAYGVSEDFDPSEYYYDEDLNVYIPISKIVVDEEEPEVTETTETDDVVDESMPSDTTDETLPSDEKENKEEYTEETTDETTETTQTSETTEVVGTAESENAT